MCGPSSIDFSTSILPNHRPSWVVCGENRNCNLKPEAHTACHKWQSVDLNFILKPLKDLKMAD